MAERLTDIVRDVTSSTRFVTAPLLGFAVSAAVLAGLGISGVVTEDAHTGNACREEVGKAFVRRRRRSWRRR